MKRPKGYGLLMQWDGKADEPLFIYDPRTELRRPAWFVNLQAALEARAIVSKLETASHFRGAKPVIIEQPEGME